jgi:hypothetical protein
MGGRTGVGLGDRKKDCALFLGEFSYINIFTLFILQGIRRKAISNVNRFKYRDLNGRRFNSLAELVLNTAY